MGRAFRVRFHSKDGGVQGEKVLHTLPIRIGRNALNECSILHPFVSDFHAIVEAHGHGLTIRDLQSRNGVTTPTGERIGQHAPFDLAITGNAFVVGRAVHVEIEPVEGVPRSVGERLSETRGSVIGNRAMLESGPAPLPPLSMAGAPMRPAFLPDAPNPLPRPGAYDPLMNQSLPGLPPLSGAPHPAAHRPGPSSAPPPAQGGIGQGTQHFAVTTEALALVGLRELASSLAPGAPVETTGDVARLLTKLHDTVEVFCRCLVPMREGYAQFLSQMDLQRAASARMINRSPAAMRVETAKDPAALAAALLDCRSPGFDAPDVVEAIFADLMMHHVALVEGVMRGIRALLESLSPEAIEQAAAEENRRGLFGQHKALWKAYEERFAEIASETRTFELVFGAEFAASYGEYYARQGRPKR
ncbi:MAG: type VI secretion system-associated FHA domain protein [Polyangiaceae bacterium]